MNTFMEYSNISMKINNMHYWKVADTLHNQKGIRLEQMFHKGMWTVFSFDLPMQWEFTYI